MIPSLCVRQGTHSPDGVAEARQLLLGAGLAEWSAPKRSDSSNNSSKNRLQIAIAITAIVITTIVIVTLTNGSKNHNGSTNHNNNRYNEGTLSCL